MATAIATIVPIQPETATGVAKDLLDQVRRAWDSFRI